MSHVHEKQHAIDDFIRLAKAQTADAVDRERLAAIERALIALAKPAHWWAEDAYPAPTGADLQARYLVTEDPDGQYALYLNVMRPGKKIVPHNHTTWACIAGVEGTENNFLYARTDGGSGAGPATLVQTGEKRVGPGNGIALLADDIHAVQIVDAEGIRHLHMYGMALENLHQRLAYDQAANTCKIMDVGVKTRGRR